MKAIREKLRPLLALGLLLPLLVVIFAHFVWAGENDSGAKPSWLPQLLGHPVHHQLPEHARFPQSLQGENSFIFDHSFKQEMTRHLRPLPRLSGHEVSPVICRFRDVPGSRSSSNGLGLGAYTNADVIRAGPANLGHGPYLARMYARYVIPLSGEVGESLTRTWISCPAASLWTASR